MGTDEFLAHTYDTYLRVFRQGSGVDAVGEEVGLHARIGDLRAIQPLQERPLRGGGAVVSHLTC